MPDAILIAQFERRLVEMGCPSRRLTESVHELAEHYEDLKQAALEDGLSEKEAETQASAQLGYPVLLAENAVDMLRESSWWGRHPILGFVVLPWLAFIAGGPVCLAILVGISWLLGFIFGPAYVVDTNASHILSDNAEAFKTFATPFNAAIHLGTIFLVLLVFCWLARRAALSLKWMLAACLSCAFISIYSASVVQPRAFTIFLSSSASNWHLAAIPLLIAGGLFIHQRWREHRFAGVPRDVEVTQRTAPLVSPRPAIYKVPTWWVTTILTLVMVKLLAWPLTNAFLEIAQKKQLHFAVWPAERAATLALLKAHQSVPLLPHEKTIDLKPLLNRTLADSLGGTDQDKENNLAALAPGIHTFDGVPFDVQGVLKLRGSALANGDKKLPTHKTIPLGSKCSRLYLLQGTSLLDQPGDRIAWLILHYQDGSIARININGGEHVLDGWGPIYNTNAGIGRYPTSPDAELAWAGSNPDIKENRPEFSLRLYRTAFANPHPELEISSIDYVSALSGPSPFLVGLTVETL
ncbi:MAG TPA: hypothetical protein VK811_03915 [Candidatus Acidoferrum sp.]|nr:hypothetical protein [Candidatus Acidoferrum sp.]